MFPGIVIFKKVVGYYVIEAIKNADDRSKMQYETIAAQQLPYATAIRVALFFAYGTEVAECAEQRRHKRGDDKKMAQLPGHQMFSYELCIHLLLSVLLYIRL